MANDEQVKEDWDIYWTAKNHKKSGVVYNSIAQFYRKNIIIKILDHFIQKHFSKGSKVLHAGCGSGQVDTNCINYLDLTALDISPEALKIYESINGKKAKTVLGSIFSLDFEENSFDGIYNLGVMEHFTEEEIHDILIQFHRILKPGGKCVLFWPPVNGVTVRFLDSAHFVLNRIFKQNIKLHPDEITRVQNEKHVRGIVSKTPFKFVEFYFGLKDYFTQAVVVIQK